MSVGTVAVKSISTTNNIKKVADYYLRKVYSTPVGFKYLADMLSKRRAFIAVESTNGASLNNIITIKDGILFNLLVTEMLAYYKLDMEKVLGNFYLKFPKLYNKEIAINKNKFIEDSYNNLLSRKEFNLDKGELKDQYKIFKVHDSVSLKDPADDLCDHPRSE